MAKSKDKINLLSQMEVFHEDARRLERDFRELVAALSGGEPEKTKDRLRAIVKSDFVDHFKFEESVVFPAVKTWAAVTKNVGHFAPIGGYLETHKRLLMGAAQAVSAFEALGTTASRREISSVAEAFAKLSKELCEHASVEDDHIVRLLKDNPTLRFLSSRRSLAK
jgi:hemerythrin superfamily protein